MEKKNMWRVRLILAMFILAMTITVKGPSVNASSKTNIEKTLKYFRKGKFKKAIKYNKKLPDFSNEACTRNMPVNMKNAYRKIIKKWNSKYDHAAYGLTDLDNDNEAELIVEYASGTFTPTRHMVYDYRNGKVKRIGKIAKGGMIFSAYPGHKAIIGTIAFRGNDFGNMVYIITFSGGKAHYKKVRGFVSYKKFPPTIENTVRFYLTGSLNRGPL